MRADVLVMGRSPQSGALGRMRDLSYAVVRDAGCPIRRQTYSAGEGFFGSLDLYARFHRHSRSQQVLRVLPLFKHNLHGYSLDDLDIISRRIFWR